ncbi:MAG TPA: hypothetical protein VIJ29_03680 [Candidatus Paceibacterota bacterium]
MLWAGFFSPETINGIDDHTSGEGGKDGSCAHEETTGTHRAFHITAK